jgi:hypothetical protein
MKSCDPTAKLLVRLDMPYLSSGKWVFCNKLGIQDRKCPVWAMTNAE